MLTIENCTLITQNPTSVVDFTEVELVHLVKVLTVVII